MRVLGGVSMRLWGAILTAGVLATGLAGCGMLGTAEGEPIEMPQPTGPPPEAISAADAGYEKALEHFDEERYEEAQKILERIIQVLPDRYDARVLLGESYLKSDRVQDALKQFSSAVASEEFKSLAMQGVGLSLLRLGDSAAAGTNLTRATEMDGTLWRAHSALGWIHDSRKEWAEAESRYRKALALMPSSAIVHNNLGMSFMLQRRFPEAVDEFRAAIKLEPRLAPLRANLRIALASQGKYVEALAGVPKKGLPDALNDVGYLAMMRGDYDNASAYFLRAMEISPTYHAVAARNLESLEALKATSRD